MYSPHSCNCSSELCKILCKIKLMENALQNPPKNKDTVDLHFMVELKFFIMALIAEQ